MLLSERNYRARDYLLRPRFSNALLQVAGDLAVVLVQIVTDVPLRGVSMRKVLKVSGVPRALYKT